MLQKSMITARALMISMTILSIGMIFIASSSVFAASSNRVHLIIVWASSSDRGCVRIRNGNFKRDVSLPEKEGELQSWSKSSKVSGTSSNRLVASLSMPFVALTFHNLEAVSLASRVTRDD
jgi:hypothetical protein